MSDQEELIALRARVLELEAQLAPYLEAEAHAAREAEAKTRAEQIAAFLFPTYSATAARADASIRPPQWHEKSWWWNGVSIKWHKSDFDQTGGSLTLSSYVGGGEVEEIDISIPKAWIDATDEEWRGLVTEFRDKKVQARVEAKAASDAAEAQRQIQQARETLARLGAST